MKKHREKLLTLTLAVIIAGFYGAESIAGEKIVLTEGLPLRVETNEASLNGAPADYTEQSAYANTNTSTIKLKGGVKIDNKEQLVTLRLVNSDLRQVLRMLAEKAGKNIVIDSSVPGGNSLEGAAPGGVRARLSAADEAGTISLDLVNVTVNKAFEYIMTIKELSYMEDGNTLIVASSERAGELGLNASEIKPIKVKYVDAQRVADFLNTNIFNLNKPEISRSGIVTSNPGTNEVYIFGNNNDYELAKKIVAQLDKKPEMKTYNINFASTDVLARKICTTVFQNDSASSSRGSSERGGAVPSVSASELTTICSGTSSSGSTAGSSRSSGGSGMSLSSFSSNSYIVMADPGLNQITLYGGTQEQVNLAEQMIKNFDKKEPQVYLEISIIELSEEGSKIFNNAYRLANSTETINSAAGNTRLEYTKNSQIYLWPDTGESHPIFNNWDSYGTTRELIGALQYIVSSSKGRVLANPRIIASNNTESTVNISEQYVVTPAATTTASVGNSGAQTTTAPVIGDAGIQLNVTPKISPNGYVTLNLSPTYSSVKPLVSGSTTGLTKTRTFNSENVRVKDGDTLVIAGLIQETENNTQSKVPVLGDIPVIGAFFKDQSTATGRSELIFMITPRIVKGDEYEAI